MGKEQSDTVRTPEVEVFSDDGFEEESSLHGPIEDLRETDFELIDREAVIVAGAAIGSWKRPRQAMRPPVEENLDVGGPKRIARGLERSRIGTGEKAVVERLEPHAVAPQLLLHPLMAVETEFHGVRQIGADLHERRTPVVIVHVEVVLIDRDPLTGELEADLHARASLLVGFEGAHFFLSDADHDDALAGGEVSAVRRGDGVFVLTGLKVHDRNRMACDKLFDRRHESIVHRLEQRGRRNRIAEIVAQEVTEAA